MVMTIFLTLLPLLLYTDRERMIYPSSAIVCRKGRRPQPQPHPSPYHGHQHQLTLFLMIPIFLR